jgi:hypothetical protein
MVSHHVPHGETQATPLVFPLEYSHTRSASLNGTRVDPSSHLLGTPLIRLLGFPTPFIDLLEQLGFVPRRPVLEKGVVSGKKI